MIKKTERGWAGHFICADRCRFRRNTLLQDTESNIEIVVSSVGLMEKTKTRYDDKTEFETIGYNRYYETMAFHADPTDQRYHDAEVNREITFESPWAINEIDADDKANIMHDVVVKEIKGRMEKGEVSLSNEPH